MVLLMSGLLLSSVAVAQTAVRYVTIGTGGVTGVYYPAGGAICRLVNKGRRMHGIRCSVESTGGSIDNIEGIRVGEFDFGVVQSDAQFAAVHGQTPFESAGKFKKLRSMFALHSEQFTVVARADAGIQTLADLKGKRVNVGNVGSGQRGTMETVMQTLGWTMNDFAEASELTSAEQSRALCDDQFDAMVFTVGHPNASINEATIACDTVLVGASGAAIKKMVAQIAYFRTTTIPGGMYRGTEHDVKTFGVSATVVTSSLIPEDMVYELVKSVFENFDSFRMLHPAFGRLEKQNMLAHGLSAPLHRGAVRYFKEVGLIK
ncbi:MAG: TAXI family TRAP transporter solute-binding subunit [Magnetovibrio sp.]|nr:TAXI family TRAP transporter solute-binding subunit [Magnetovibrio sp.]